MEPRGEGIVLWTLRFGDEVRPEDSYFAEVPEKADASLVPLVQSFIKGHTKPWSPTMVSDPVQSALLDIIAEKKKALKPARKGKAKQADRDSESNVIDIMEALRRSLAPREGKKRAS